MSETVVVLGAGYAGAGAVPHLEARLPDADLVWISEHDYHLVLHESHRLVRDPSVREHVTVPVDAIRAPGTAFVEGEVVDLDPGARRVELADGRRVEYDYALAALGSGTAFYGIPGLREHALTLKSLDDALAIHGAVADAAAAATPGDPARVVVGGAGLSGIQVAGEIAGYRDDEGAAVEVRLVEALEEVLPGGHPSLQAALRGLLAEAGVRVRTDDPVTAVEDGTVQFDRGEPLAADVLVWTGGISGRDCLGRSGLDDEGDRLRAGATFETSDDRVFAVGDCALVAQPDGDVAPATAQAAWSAAEVAAGNVARTVEGRPPREWTHRDRGTLVSVGESAVAHGVGFAPVRTFDSLPARVLKKAAAARWIAAVSSWRRALAAWPAL